MNIIRHNNFLIVWWAVFSLALAIFLLRGIIWEPGLPYTRDLIFPYNLSSTLSHQLSTWNDMHSQRNLEINKIPVFWIFKIGSDILGSENLVKVFFVVVLFSMNFVIFTSLFMVFRNNVKSTIRLAAICGIPSLFYLFNPWVVDRISNHIFMVFGMALNPLIIIMYTKMLEKGGGFLYYVLVAILLTFISMLSTHNVFYIIPLIVFAGLFYTIFSANKRKIILSTCSFFAIYVLLNSYWIFPVIYESSQATISPSYSFSLGEIERLSQFNTPSNLFRFIGGGAWEPFLQYPSGATLSVFFSFLVSLFSLSAVILSPKNIFVLLLGVLFCVLYILALGTNSPFPIYEWLSTTAFSGILWIYRDPSRLIQYMVLVCTLLLAFTLYRLVSSSVYPRFKTVKLSLPYIIMASIIVSPAAFTFVNAGGNRLVSQEFPSQYVRVYDFFSKDADDYKVLWLPLRQYHLYDWNEITDVSADVYSVSSPKPTYGFSTQSSANNTRILQYIYNDLLLEYRTDEIGLFLSMYEIKYVVVHTDLIGSHLDHAEKVLQVLAHQKDMKLVEQDGPYYIFENTHYGINGKKFFKLDTDRGYKELVSTPLLGKIPDNISIGDLGKWNKSENSFLWLSETSNETLVKWDSLLDSEQKESAVRINFENNLNMEAFDKFELNIFPAKLSASQQLRVVLYTNTSQFSFLPRALEPGEWNKESFDLRNAKIVAANRGQHLNLENVIGIGMRLITESYNGSDNNYPIFVKGISLNSDSPYGQYNPARMIERLPNREDQDPSLRFIKEAPTKYSLSLNASKPYILGFAEPFDPVWVARYKENGAVREHKSIPLFPSINGFYINMTGKHEIELIHKPAEFQSIGTALSVSALFISLGYLIWQRLPLRVKMQQEWENRKVTSMKEDL